MGLLNIKVLLKMRKILEEQFEQHILFILNSMQKQYRGIKIEVHLPLSPMVFRDKTSNLETIAKRNRKMETWAVLLIFLLELEISGVAVQSIYKGSKKCDFCCGEFLSKK